MSTYDAVVIGSGPNGLAAAIACAKAGERTLLIEASSVIGGGLRTEELTLPGFRHDVCSAVHPLAVASPYYSSLKLQGVEWTTAKAQAAQTLLDRESVYLFESVSETAEGLDREDAATYRRLMTPLVDNWPKLVGEILRPVLRFPRHPLLMARFGATSVWPAESFIKTVFKGERAKALFAGVAAHANAPLTTSGTSAVAMMLMLAAHAKGWPIPKGGADQFALALANKFRELGGEIRLGEKITSLKQIPPAKRLFFDLTPRQIAGILSEELSPSSRAKLENYRYGPGVYKMDWALSAPIPWRDEKLALSPTVHVAADTTEILASEAAVAKGLAPDRPYLLLSQPTLFDFSRAPKGKHIAWAYCHVPSGSTADMRERIENQIERFAPGFKETVLARHVLTPATLESHNANLIGGDISGGAFNIKQLLFRPYLAWNPYQLPLAKMYMCSSSTPPGPGVHGMCGYNAVVSSGVAVEGEA